MNGMENIHKPDDFACDFFHKEIALPKGTLTDRHHLELAV